MVNAGINRFPSFGVNPRSIKPLPDPQPSGLLGLESLDRARYPHYTTELAPLSRRAGRRSSNSSTRSPCETARVRAPFWRGTGDTHPLPLRAPFLRLATWLESSRPMRPYRADHRPDKGAENTLSPSGTLLDP